MNPSPAAIRQFILDTFNDEDFEAFCANYFPAAQADISAGMPLRIKALRLVDYCRHHSFIGNLLAALRKERQQQYVQRFTQVTAIPTTGSTPVDLLVLEQPFHLELVRVPAGEFLMGSDPAKDEDAGEVEQPQHRVYVSEFYIGKFPVTNTQYAVYTRAEKGKSSVPKGKDDHPVVQVSWKEATAFCHWLSQVTSREMRLPTEAEWEKAARGTDGRRYPWGKTWGAGKANAGVSERRGTTPVGKYSPFGDSPYGVADMAGNVWEWCADWYNANEYKERAKSSSHIKDPKGPSDGDMRVVRGGSWLSGRYDACASYRVWVTPDSRGYDCGFRVVAALLSNSVL